eukprot:Anaeramoba_ignava/a350157_10.p2 GENE.a350157_10~~a350157_10.p2  ORF type:complete len:155 (-),score=12.94 a350157_10:616-1080(-)
MNQVKKESEIDMKTKDLASFDIKGKFEAAQNVYENYLKVSLPELSSGIQRVVRHQLPQEEKFDIEVAYPLTEKYEYVIPLSNDFEIVETPVQVAIDNRLFNLKVNVQKSDKELVIKKTISIKSTRISASEYNEFRSFVQNLKADKQNQFIIKKK